MQFKFTRSMATTGMISKKTVFQVIAQLMLTPEEAAKLKRYPEQISGKMFTEYHCERDDRNVLTSFTVQSLLDGWTLQDADFNVITQAENDIIARVPERIVVCDALDTFNGTPRVVEV